MRMNFHRSASWSSRFVLATAVSCSLATPAVAENFQIPCNKGGDQLGFSVSTNGDFNGDGVRDIAVGSPCFFVRGNKHAGRVVIIDGRNGRRLFRKRGAQENQWFGAAVSFLPDLNGDGRDEIAIGSPGYDVSKLEQKDPLNAKALDRAGRVDVFQRGRRRFRIFGTASLAGLGEKIAPLNDINGDNRADFVVTATGDRNANGRSQPGRAWIVSGRNGTYLGHRIGPSQGNSYGRSLAAAGDLDGDGLHDFLVGSDESNYPGILRAGIVDAISSVDPQGTPLFQTVGAKQDRLGRTVDFAGDINDDGVPEVLVGSGGSDDTGVKLSGLVSLIDLKGRRIWSRASTKIQEGARFGDSIATVGDINGDGIADFAASSPGQDYVIDKKLVYDAGRVVMLSGLDGQELWANEGVRRDEEFGYALDGHIDFDLDEIPDLVVGTPGDDPFGRRGAGSLKILSGADGHVLHMLPGRRGLETRTVTATLDDKGGVRLRAFNRSGKRRDMNVAVLDKIRPGELSIAILNDDPFNKQGDPHVAEPRGVQVAVTGGYGSNRSTVEIYRLGKQSKLIDSFQAFDSGNFGVECGAGETNGEVNEELVCAQADRAAGDVKIRIFQRLDEETPFFLTQEFVAFSKTDLWNNVTPIDAEGANVVIGHVTGDKQAEIIVGTTRGLPVVRIFKRDGTLIRTFLAYNPVEHSGVDVTVADLDGSGDNWIVTAPREGSPLIKVFNGNGDRVGWGPTNEQIAILAKPLPYVGGARVAAADLDLDDKQEILVMVPGQDEQLQVFGYEPTNKPVAKWTPFFPLYGGRQPGGAVAGTDRWVRN
jgi:hypothetical protein